jgi:hypothetical protein
MKRTRKSLKIKCTSSECGNGLHCFKATGEMVKANHAGECRSCGASPIDWGRVHECDIADVDYTIEALNHECVRNIFWHRPLGQHAINHARRKGKIKLKERVRHHLESSIGPAHPFRDGYQTPMEENPSTALPYAQHATATCCRKCLEYWHKIPLGQDLTADQLDYATALVCQYIEARIPEMTQNGERIPPIRNKSHGD